MWTVSDFPTYSMLSGWKTKWRFSYPSCNYDTCSQYLKHIRKTCYMGHRRFLKVDYPWWFDEHSFNGGKEKRLAPSTLSSSDVLERLSNVKNDFGKDQQKKKPKIVRDPGKRGLYSLNCLIESTIRVNITLMSCILRKIFVIMWLGRYCTFQGSQKTTLRLIDLVDLGIEKHLQPYILGDG